MALGFRTMEQRISVGNDFNGTVPPGDMSRADSLELYPISVSGGRFDFSLDAPVFVRSVEIHLGGQSAWTLHKLDVNNRELLLMRGTDETDFMSTLSESFIMTARQVLLLRTTGATAELLCRITIQSPV